ncbi:MAG: Gfo/Idh/MocA family protein, partial [Pseudobdellovibrio sp.]
MKKKKVKYAVVGLGHIAQVAVIPAFKNSKSSELYALVSGDRQKLKILSNKYNVEKKYYYRDFNECLKDDNLDAVYISLPNHLHYQYVLRAAEAGKHILCEKPLAVTSHQARQMIAAARFNNIKLMTAYRLHFDPANLKAIELVQSGKIGRPRYFTSEFGHQIKEDNIRASFREGGSPLHDLGIYCINAARYLMQAEPIEVFAMAASPAARLPEIEQTVTATMRFPQDQLATFTCSFASAGVTNYRVVGDKGNLFIENVYDYTGEVTHHLTVDEKTKTWTSKPGDQFAAELDYFSSCILKNKNPEPSGTEGLVDLMIIEALLYSIKTGKAVRLHTPKV